MIPIALFAAAVYFGLPNLRLQYNYTPLGGETRLYHWCDYIGIRGVRRYHVVQVGGCPLVAWLPLFEDVER